MIKKQKVNFLLYYLNLFFLVFVFSLLNFTVSYTETETTVENADFKSAMSNYLKGDINNSLISSEKAYQADPSNIKFKKLYLKLLILKTEELFASSKFSEDIPYLKKILKIDKNNSRALNLLNSINRQLNKKETKVDKPKIEKSKETINKIKVLKEPMVNEEKKEEKPVLQIKTKTQVVPSNIKSENSITSINDINNYFKNLSEEKKMIIVVLLSILVLLFIGILILLIVFLTKKDKPVIEKQKDSNKFQEKITSNIDEISSLKMIQDPNAHVRAKGIELLEQEMLGKEPLEIEKTIQPMLDDPDNRVKANAAIVMYKYNKELTLETLRVMCEDPDKWMRMSAAYALNKIGTVECIKILQTMVNDKDSQVQSSVLNYLFKNRPSSARKMLEDAIPYIREKGLELLEQELDIEDSGVAEKLLEPLLADSDSRVRASACKVMHKFNRNKAFSTLKEMTKDEDKWMRVNAAWILSKIEDPESIKILQSMSEDPDLHVQSRVLDSLLKVKATKSEKDEIYSKLQEKAKKNNPNN